MNRFSILEFYLRYFLNIRLLNLFFMTTFIICSKRRFNQRALFVFNYPIRWHIPESWTDISFTLVKRRSVITALILVDFLNTDDFFLFLGVLRILTRRSWKNNFRGLGIFFFHVKVIFRLMPFQPKSKKNKKYQNNR